MIVTQLTITISSDDEDAIERRRVAWGMDTKEQVLRALVDASADDAMVEYHDEFGVSISVESDAEYPNAQAFMEKQSPEDLGDVE